MLDKYTFNRFEALAEKLMRETRESLNGTKSDRLIDNRVRGFFLAILDSLLEMELLKECECGGFTLKDDSPLSKVTTQTVTKNYDQNIQ
jgi:hypothetical protein